MYNTSFIKKFLLALTVVFFYSCDKDFNAIGDGLVGDDHFGFEPEEYNVLAFNQEVTPVQSNVLAVNGLGIFDNPLFGTTTANFVTQLGLETYAPTIGESPVIESAVLTIPYFSTKTATSTDGEGTYRLDSIYGNKDGKLKLSVYESKMQMRNSYFSGGAQLPQLYYTDQNTEFFSNVGDLLNTGGVLENEQFFFDSKEIVTKTTDADGKETVTRETPRMILNLKKEFFQDKILAAAASKLSTEDLFREYFRGLYFKVEKSGSSPSNMALIDFTGGVITIKYKAKTASTTDDVNATEDKKIVIKLESGLPNGANSTASLLQDVREPAYESAITTNVNQTQGDNRLYLKGGQGSLAVIRLNDFAAQLETIRKTNWKVNEANLVFYIDAAKMANTKEPQRVYLYDLTNNTILLDYSTDETTLGGLITLDSNKKGKFYKLKITNHIRNLIKDTTAKNVDLGLVVSQTAPTTLLNALKNKIQIKNDPIEYFSAIPRISVMSPLGTILYGSNIPAGDADYNKRVKLEVYYTKPN